MSDALFTEYAPKQPIPNILNFGRPDKPFRQVQIEALEWFAKNYDDFDVFVIEAPTATGKSMIVTTIAQFLAAMKQRSSVITPTKLLQDQYLRDFNDIPVLKGMSSYPCSAMGLDGSCRDTKQRLGQCCTAGKDEPPICDYLIARAEAAAATTALFNFHSYYANKMYKNVLIADEAHNAISFLLDFYALKLWKCEVDYEDDIQLNGQGIKKLVEKTINSLQMHLIDLQSQGAENKTAEKVENEIERLGYVRDSIERFKDDLLIQKDTAEYFGNMKELRKTKQEHIYVKPVRVDKIGGDFLWPKQVNKIVLLSATISDLDVKRLGLDAGKRVAYYRCDSPIPANRRPFFLAPVASMKYDNRAKSFPRIITAIQMLAKHHHDQKGVIHCTYDSAQKLKAVVGKDPRYWFHDKFNKTEVYNRFRAMPGNQILVASGMEEGIDLAFDAGRWQVITQLMRPNVEDKVNKWMYQNDRTTYNWETIRKIIQQTGRICRDPADFGVTYMLDSEFEYFYGTTGPLWPQWFKDGMLKINLNVP